MQEETVTLIVAGLGIAGTLCGTIVGNLFQTRGQHQQWRRDNIRQECRELLGQLSVNLFTFIDWRKSIAGREVGLRTADVANKYSDAVLDLHRNFMSRILIAEELKKANVPQPMECRTRLLRWGLKETERLNTIRSQRRSLK